MITPSASSWRSRWVIGSMFNMRASLGSAPGPLPNIARPPLMWSSCTIRWATLNGWWYGSDTTPVPSMMRWVTIAAEARNISGLAIISHPVRVVLADPELVVPETVEMCGQLEVTLELARRALAREGGAGRGRYRT